MVVGIYLLAYGVILFAIFTKPPPASDYFIHLAVIRTLAEGGKIEEIPILRERALMVRHHDPYHLFWAAVMKHTVARGTTIMALAGAVNVAVFLGGIAFLARALGRRWVGPVGLLLIMLLVMREGYNWSGEYFLSALPISASYPSTLAWGLGFGVLGLVHRWTLRGGVWRLVIASCVAAFVVMNHALTALVLVLPLPVLWVWASRTSWRRRIFICAYPAAGLALSLLWPYHSVFGQVSKVLSLLGPVRLGGRSGALAFLSPRNLFLALGPIPFAVLCLAWTPRHAWRQLLAASVAYGVLWVGGTFLGAPFAHRFVFFLVFALHLLLATCLQQGVRIWLSRVREKTWRKAIVPMRLTVVGTLVLAGAALHIPRFVRLVGQAMHAGSASLSEFERSCEEVRRLLPPGAKVLAADETAFRAPAFGLPVLPPEIIAAQMRKQGTRDRMMAALYLGATHLLENRPVLGENDLKRLESLGKVSRVSERLVLVELPR